MYPLPGIAIGIVLLDLVANKLEEVVDSDVGSHGELHNLPSAVPVATVAVANSRLDCLADTTIKALRSIWVTVR